MAFVCVVPRLLFYSSLSINQSIYDAKKQERKNKCKNLDERLIAVVEGGKRKRCFCSAGCARWRSYGATVVHLYRNVP